MPVNVQDAACQVKYRCFCWNGVTVMRACVFRIEPLNGPLSIPKIIHE